MIFLYVRTVDFIFVLCTPTAVMHRYTFYVTLLIKVVVYNLLWYTCKNHSMMLIRALQFQTMKMTQIQNVAKQRLTITAVLHA